MSSEDECDFSSGVNSPKSIEFVEDDINIDIEILTNKVKARPLFWDKSLNNYSDRYLKRTAWKEIFILLNPDYEKISSEHQKLIGKYSSNII
ncbi:MADF domain [Cinara cedri]|uniref:MADF domain n=1 Tax=Cinara cedri TaxID=506608 RepID=A0A5E4NQI4_9HEMI|nr:MADF domain [Cinara cedri]